MFYAHFVKFFLPKKFELLVNKLQFVPKSSFKGKKISLAKSSDGLLSSCYVTARAPRAVCSSVLLIRFWLQRWSHFKLLDLTLTSEKKSDVWLKGRRQGFRTVGAIFFLCVIFCEKYHSKACAEGTREKFGIFDKI